MKKHNYFMVFLVFLTFAVISFLTNIINSILTDAQSSFSLSNTLAGLLPFAFFIAYVLSIPAGMLVERIKEKAIMNLAFFFACLGAVFFSLAPRYPVFLVTLFMIGIGMAFLQVAINPLLRVSGGEEHFAFNSVAAQFVFGLASYLSPEVYSYLVTSLRPGASPSGWLLGTLRRLVPADMGWVSIYVIFSVVTLAMVVVIALSRFPRVERKEDEITGTWGTHRELLRDRYVPLFFVGIFCYVGTEQGVSNWIKKFLATYHGFPTETVGNSAVSQFWGLMTLGCLLGLLLLKLFDSRRVLGAFALLAMVLLSGALFGPAQVSLWSFKLLGFAASVMWSIIFSLALNSVRRHHGTFSGILCTGIIGGAVVPALIGFLSDLLGLRAAMCLLYLTVGYILSIGFWARPLIVNKTIDWKRKETGA